MACFVLRRAILRKPGETKSKKLACSISKSFTGLGLKQILVVVVCVVAFVRLQTPAARAQHPGGHPGAGGHVGGGAGMAAPPRAPIPQPRAYGGPRGYGVRGVGPHFRAGGASGFRFVPRPINGFRHRFFGRSFFRFGAGWEFNSWWSPCGPAVGWNWSWGYDCYPAPVYGAGFENYVTLPAYEAPMYMYGGEDRELVWLYLKDGAVYRVNDYWFVKGDLHFSVVEEDPLKPGEHVAPSDELDVQKSTYVNSQRGFRMVVRDEPWQQYLKDHPEATPPDLAPPEKN